MSQDEFAKLFQYVEKRFDEMSQKFEEAHTEREDIRGAVAELSGQIRDYHQEMLMLAHKVDRLEKWIHQVAEKTGVKLEY